MIFRLLACIPRRFRGSRLRIEEMSRETFDSLRSSSRPISVS